MTAVCEAGIVQCTGRGAVTNCSSVDFDFATHQRGSVTCNGVTTQCPLMGEVCHLEQRPAATLLLPYFEVAAGGQNTMVAVGNAYDEPVMVQADVWTDLGVHVLAFYIYLDGNDVQTFTLSDVLLKGELPKTAAPAGAIGSSCRNALEVELSSSLLQAAQASLQGRRRLTDDKCAGFDHGDAVLRGYMTFEAIRDCTFSSPNAPAFFAAGGTGEATNQNVLWGDYIYIDFPVKGGTVANPVTNLVKAGLPMVHLRASTTDPATASNGRYTFYGASTSWTAADNRQPLATNFQARFFNTPAVNTDLIVWRDSKMRQQSAFTCGRLPLWYPLDQKSLLAFDEQIQKPNSTFNVTGQPFALVTQRVHIGPFAGNLSLPYPYGWLSMDLNDPAAGPGPPYDPLARQAWVTVLDSFGTTGMSMDAIRQDTACEALHKP
ncbi:MAG TPA: hypothetical protein VF789_34480 [Thermoanaerobaculia bacterium]